MGLIPQARRLACGLAEREENPRQLAVGLLLAHIFSSDHGGLPSPAPEVGPNGGGVGGPGEEIGIGGTVDVVPGVAGIGGGLTIAGLENLPGPGSAPSGLTVVGLGNPPEDRPVLAPIGTPVGPDVKELDGVTLPGYGFTGEACPKGLVGVVCPKLELLEGPCARPGLPPRGVTPEPVDGEEEAGGNGELVPVVAELLTACEDGGTLVRAVAL